MEHREYSQPADVLESTVGRSIHEVGRTSELRASFVRTADRTTLYNKYHTAPIKIAKAFPLNGQLGIIVMDASPGLLDGDSYRMAWKSERGSHVMITNQSYMKVHPCMPFGGSALHQSFQVDEDAIVEHMPEPIMLYKHAILNNVTTVHLQPGAVWMQGDVLCPGRTLRGERFDYRCYSNSLTVHYGDELIFSQKQRVEPARQSIQSPGCFEEMTHFATFYLFSDRVNSELLEQLQQTLDKYTAPAGHEVIAGASLTYKHGAAVTATSTAAWPLQQLLKELWNKARLCMLDKQPLQFLQG